MHWNWFRKVPQRPVNNPKLQRIQDQRDRRTRQLERQARRQSMKEWVAFIAVAVFSILLLGIAGAARDAIGPFYGEVVVAICVVVVVVFGVAVWVAARGQQLAAWRLFWIGAAIICAASGWYVSPATQESRLARAAVESASKLDLMRTEDPAPTTPFTKQRLLAHENEAALWRLKWDQWVQENRLRRADPDRAHGASATALLWGIAALFVICAVAAKSIFPGRETVL